MAGFTLSERIQAPPEEVFAFLVDVDNATKVFTTVKRTEKLGNKAVDVGTRYLQVRQVAGNEYSGEYEVLEIDPPRLYVVSSLDEGIRATYRYQLEPVGGSTLIRLECDVKGEGLSSLLAWLVARAMQRDDASLLLKFREAFGAATDS